jgi:HPt (histidine-containing phosphotransfer) domain-containing protein
MFKLFKSCFKENKSEKSSTESITNRDLLNEIEQEFLEKISGKNESLERELTKEEKKKLKQIILMLNLYEYNML